MDLRALAVPVELDQKVRSRGGFRIFLQVRQRIKRQYGERSQQGKQMLGQKLDGKIKQIEVREIDPLQIFRDWIRR